ncbi:PAS domain S-box protein [candidate division KSB1 bacterium]|nr:PAS domain S-box protein [candidate division KSB1 bacterium]
MDDSKLELTSKEIETLRHRNRKLLKTVARLTKKIIQIELSNASSPPKSNTPENNLKLLLPEASQNIEDLAFLYRTAFELVDLAADANIFDFIAQQVHRYLGNVGTVVSSYDETSQTIEVKAIAGFSFVLKYISKILKQNPIGMRFHLMDRARFSLEFGKLVRLPDQLIEIGLKEIPAKALKLLQRLLGLRSFYSINLIWDEKRFGNLTLVFREKQPVFQIQIIETFIKQVSVAFQRVQVFNALEASEFRFRQMAENIQDGIVIIENEKIQFINDQVCEIYGYSREQLIQQNLINLFISNAHSTLKEFLAQFQKNEKPLAELKYWITRQDGTPRFVHNRYAVLQNNEAAYTIYIIISDITENKRIEDELRKLSGAIIQSPATVMITDAHGNIEFVNPKFTEITGYSMEEVIGKNPRFLKAEHNPAVNYVKMWRTIQRGEEYHGEFKNMRKNGEIYWESYSISAIRDNKGNILHFIKVAEDITRRKIAEERIQFLGSIAEQVRDSIIVLDLNYKISYVNKATEDLYGYTADELIGKDPILLISEQNGTKIQQKIYETLSKNQIWLGSYWNRKKDDTTFICELKISPIYDPDGQITAYLAIQRDITARKKVEDELEKYREHLEEIVEKRTHELRIANQELEAFTYSVSHDLRAPLRAMHGFSQVLLDEYGNLFDANGQDYVRRIIGASKKMDTLIQDLLAYSRISRTQIQLNPVNLLEVIENAQSQLEKEIQDKNARIVTPGDIPQVIGHHGILEQVLTNLISNAIKFVRPDTQPLVEIKAETIEDWLRLWVIDNGIGIAEEYHERIFQVFERLHGVKQYPGTGIGLAIVRKGMERLGGTVGLKSTPGSGSQFFIELIKKR